MAAGTAEPTLSARGAASSAGPEVEAPVEGGLGAAWRGLARLPREEARQRLVYGLKRPLYGLPLYRWSLGGSQASNLTLTPSDPWPGSAERGQALIAGRFELAGQALHEPEPLWAPRNASPAWRQALHGFSWLRDLRALGGDQARRSARALVKHWLASHQDWSPLAWSPAVIGTRLGFWLSHYDHFAASAAPAYRRQLIDAMLRQARHLDRVLPAGLLGQEALAALKGLILAGICLPGARPLLPGALARLEPELARQILPDGGQVERSPSRQAAILRDLIDLRAVLRQADETPPAALGAAIEAMAPLLRRLRLGDGGLALFNESNEEESLTLDMVLSRAQSRPRSPMGTPEGCQSGFRRLEAGRSILILDAGRPPGPGSDAAAHAGTLSFEMSVGRQRLIVNCGSLVGNPTWRRLQRLTAAHSTLVVEDCNSAELASGSGLIDRARRVEAELSEAEGHQLLEASHDGYAKRFGLIHARRLFLAEGGLDLRGEDRLSSTDADLEALKAGREARFAIRFHLHPEVRAGLAQGGRSVLLRLGKPGGGRGAKAGEGWVFRADAALIEIEPSIYLGKRGQVRRCQQIVLSGHCRDGEALVRWALRQESGEPGAR